MIITEQKKNFVHRSIELNNQSIDNNRVVISNNNNKSILINLGKLFIMIMNFQSGDENHNKFVNEILNV